MRLPMPAALATLMAAVVVSATPAAAIERPAKPAGTEFVTRIADIDRSAGAPYRRSGRVYRHRRSGYWRVRPLVITAGHPLHYFPGEIVYTYFPGDCCCCRGR